LRIYGNSSDPSLGSVLRPVTRCDSETLPCGTPPSRFGVFERGDSPKVDCDRDLIAQLEEAVEHRTVIGKALGILMERFDLDDEEAFTYLARCSNEQNRKLYDIAADFVRLRELPQTSRPAQSA
jgi:hypothetical protein